ncbi:MAG: holo-ACP synthase [Chthoniobacter sp.]|nr:holo-ACP synthase [Chthoniobacter sp.]
MIVVGLGVDIVETSRLAASVLRYGEAFLDRVFLESERSYCDAIAVPERCYAARFAAKEAVAKALGTGIGAELGWRDIEILRLTSGAPAIQLHGTGAETATRLGVRAWRISLSHSDHYAVASVIALGGA